MIVWLLFAWINGKPIVVDNIASEKNCVGLYRQMEIGSGAPRQDYWSYKCIAVRKVK